jgi:hypothetical protein
MSRVEVQVLGRGITVECRPPLYVYPEAHDLGQVGRSSQIEDMYIVKNVMPVKLLNGSSVVCKTGASDPETRTKTHSSKYK